MNSQDRREFIADIKSAFSDHYVTQDYVHKIVGIHHQNCVAASEIVATLKDLTSIAGDIKNVKESLGKIESQLAKPQKSILSNSVLKRFFDRALPYILIAVLGKEAAGPIMNLISPTVSQNDK